MKRFFLIAAIVICAALPARAADMAAYKALYELSMGATDATSRYQGAEGIVTRSVERTCDGWIVAEQMELRILTRVGGIIDRDVRFTSWESLDGKAYRFAGRSVSKAAGEDKGYKGNLRVGREGGGGTAEFSVPPGKTVAVPDNTYLPMGHLRHLLAVAATGAKTVQFNLFDGGQDNGPESMSSVFVKRLSEGASEKPVEGDAALASVAGWRVNAAFFDVKNTQQSTPNYQVDMDLLDNGLPRRLVLDLGGFSIIQTLKKVEALPAPKC